MTIRISCSTKYLNDLFIFFFFNDTATTEIYTLSLHDALPISESKNEIPTAGTAIQCARPRIQWPKDRKSTRLNSSHGYISYAVFCLKKKKKIKLSSKYRQLDSEPHH